MKAFLSTGPRGKFVGSMDASIYRVVSTSTQEVEIGIRSDVGPQVINLRLTCDEANYLANMLLNALQDAPIVV